MDNNKELRELSDRLDSIERLLVQRIERLERDIDDLRKKVDKNAVVAKANQQIMLDPKKRYSNTIGEYFRHLGDWRQK